MRKIIIFSLIAGFVFLGGCKTVRNAAVGTGVAIYSTGKGLVDDVCDAYKVVDKADKWFAENYW
ncbi:MAG: hypothetical protein GY858_08300 [Candidatus Omnitrophica bacterium]|nr:hypothetical protein [Candidatus Omnitrophota bacterium]